MLSDLYKSKGVPSEDQIRLEKNIVIIKPTPCYDITKALISLGLSPFEVSVTYPKKAIEMQEEIFAIAPKLVIQVSKRFFRKYPFVNDNGEHDESFKKRIYNALSDRYVSLHHHDEYSLKDGLGTVNDMVKLLRSQNRSFCCITNHGSIGGWIKQHNACKKSGIKAIYGMEAYVSDYRGDDPEEKKKHRSAAHLILLAKTQKGFDNIIQIHNDAQLNGFYYSPRANYEALKKWGTGIVASSACLGGEIPQFLMKDEKEKAKELVEFYKSVFDEFYLEIQIIEFEQQREANRRIIELARETNTPLILASDGHYLDPTHAETHDLLMLSRQHKTIYDKQEKEEDVWNFDVRNLYYRNAEQMEEPFKDGFTTQDGERHEKMEDEVFTAEVLKEAMDNTRKVAVETDEIVLDSEIKLPKLYDDSRTMLKDKVIAGFKKRGLPQKSNRAEYKTRLLHEFHIINKLGWADYFLIMDKIVQDAISDYGEWVIGYGRGCFTPDTRVIMENGLPLFISEVKEGDMVIADDGSKRRVLDRYEYDIEEEICEVEVDDGRKIKCTLDHKWKVKRPNGEYDWAEAQFLKEDDELVDVLSRPPQSQDGNLPKVRGVQRALYKGSVVDLCVEDRHTYNVEGLAVHNSAAGSLVSCCLGITDIDPLEHGLLFERFLDEGRMDPPDIDMDFDPRYRDLVKEKIIKDFGEDKTCSIGTYQTYKTKAVILNVARTLGLDVHEANRVTKKMESLKSFENDEGESEKVDDMSFTELRKHYPELDEYLNENPEVEVHAKILRNQIGTMGKHAGGVIISDKSLNGKIPVQRDKNGIVISSWAESGNTAELSEVGLVKYDILGLCLDENTRIKTKDGDIPIKYVDGAEIAILDREGNERYTDEFMLICTGKKDCLEITLDDGSVVVGSEDHQLFIKNKVRRISDLETGDETLTDTGYKKVSSIKYKGRLLCYDISLFEHEDLFLDEPNFLLGNGIVSHNCNLSVIGDCVKLVKENRGIELKRKDMPLNDKESIMAAVAKRDMLGIFQLSNPGTLPVIDAVEMENIEDVSAITSLIRPGPKDEGMDMAYARRKHGEPYEVPDCLESIMRETYGVMCISEGTSITLLDGSTLPIEEMKAGMRVPSIESNKFESDICDGCGPTRRADGLRITLENNYSIVLTDDHKVMTIEGMMEAGSLVKDSLVMVGHKVLRKGEMTGSYPTSKLREIVSDSGMSIRSYCSANGLSRQTLRRETCSYQTAKKWGIDFGDIRYVRVKKIETVKDVQFYGMSVRKNHNLVANRIIVSNCYQEQMMQISKTLCGFDGPKANQLRKACGKKLKDLMKSIRKDFIDGAKPRIDAKEITLKQVEDIWDLIASFASYSFNKSVDKDTKVITQDGVRRIEDIQADQEVWCCNGDSFELTKVVALHDHGVLPAFEIKFDEGDKEVCSLNHKFLTKYGQKSLGEILKLDHGVCSYAKGRMEEITGDSLEEFGIERMSVRKVLRARFVGFRQMYDLEVCHPSHNFILASGLVTSNSHAVSYSAITTVEMYLKHNYFIEYMTALINNTDRGKKKHGSDDVLVDYINYSRRNSIDVLPPSISTSKTKFTIDGNSIRFSLGHVKNVASNAAQVVNLQPFFSMEDFFERCQYGTPVKSGVNAGKMRVTRPNKKVVESLIAAGCFDSFGDKHEMLAAYYAARNAKKKMDKEIPEYTDDQWRNKEIEMLGFCLSDEPLFIEYRDLMKKNKWFKLGDASKSKRIRVVGRVMEVRRHTSKAGKSMLKVKITDNVDTMTFFVWRDSMNDFKNIIKVGYVISVPLDKFEDGDTRFYDRDKSVQIIDRG